MTRKILSGPYYHEPVSYESTALRKLLQVEQPVGDISNMFLKVTYHLDELDDSDFEENGATALAPLWDKHCQEFLELAADSRRNMYIAVAIMDVCNDGVNDGCSNTLLDDEIRRAFSVANKLALSDSHSSFPETRSEDVELLIVSKNWHELYEAPLFNMRLQQVIIWHPMNADGGQRKRLSSTSTSRGFVATPMATVMRDIEKVADRIEDFATTWSALAKQIEAWSAYLSRHASDLPLTPGEDTLLHEVAGMWDAIMDMKHAAIIRRGVKGNSSGYTRSGTDMTSSSPS
ncbi:hypothetical protein OH77DRAFT_1437807 [Trametes cingulata]|nr:hypothetical protein OH77DRAFT_1437807 [Trametes cingulata]